VGGISVDGREAQAKNESAGKQEFLQQGGDGLEKTRGEDRLFQALDKED
jgi:hypothetical protein